MRRLSRHPFAGFPLLTLQTRHLLLHVGRLHGDAVDGRVCRDEIRVGDTFSQLYEQDFVTSGGKITRSEMIPRGSVDLEVVKLMAYGRELDFMSPGMTCRAYLRGDFLPLGEGTFIGGIGAPGSQIEFYGTSHQPMSAHVVKTIYSADHQRKVDIVERKDGAFSFEDWSFSNEAREMCWVLTSRKGLTLVETAEQAEAEAFARLAWLSTDPGVVELAPVDRHET